MKTLLIVYSYHHNNTLKIAQAMAKVLNAQVKTTDQAKDIQLDEYDLIGFGAGIDSGMHYKELLDFANDIETSKDKKCFIFSTCGMYTQSKMYKDHKKLKDILVNKEYKVLGEFSCKGFNTNVFLKYFGGINKGCPTNEDISNAKNFANELISMRS